MKTKITLGVIYIDMLPMFGRKVLWVEENLMEKSCIHTMSVYGIK